MTQQQIEAVEPIARTLSRVAIRVLFAAARAAADAFRDEVEQLAADYTAQQIRAGR
jgi:hypothetical protein